MNTHTRRTLKCYSKSNRLLQEDVLVEKKFAELVLKFRWLIIVVGVLICGLAASGIRFIEISTEPRDNFGQDNPQLIAFEELEETFSRIDNVFFAIAPKDGNVFQLEVLKVIEDLTEEAWTTKGVSRVDSLTNYQHTEAFEDDLLVSNLIEFPEELTQAELDEKRAIALSEPLVVHRLISEDGKVAGINVDFRFDKSDKDAQEHAAKWAWAKKAEIMAAHPNIDVYATGAVIISASFSESAINDLKIQTPLMYAFVVIVMGLLLRSVVGVLGIVVTTSITIACGMGMGGWLGLQLSPMSSQAPVIMLTVVVAHGIHLLVSYYQNIRSGMEKYESMIDALSINIQPIALTSLSTLIGFLSLNILADVPPIQTLGNLVSLGVIFAFIFSVTFLPALVYILPNRVKPSHSISAQYMGKLAEFVLKRRTQLLISVSAITLVLVAMAPLNVISDQFSKYFDESKAIRIDTDFTDKNLGGLYRIEYSLDTQKPQGVSDPAYLATIDDFAIWLRQQEGVGHVNTYTDILKRLNKNLHNDDANWYKLPGAQDLAAQYLLLYELSLPFGLDLTNQINFDKSSSRLVVSLPSMKTPDFIALQQKATQWLDDNAPALSQEGASAALMFTHIGIRAMEGSVKGALLALVLISIVLIITLRSLRIGLISLIPNFLPGVTGFGVWYLLSGEVGQSLSMVLGVTMGIVVDDTVHFLSKYLRARNEQNLSPEDAIRYAFRSVGVALWITTLVLVAGFSMLALSSFKPNGDMGLMVSIVISIALILDFLLLPPLLLLLDSDKAKPSTFEAVSAN